ncbi:MAG: GNAT family N-acetyltransferase [bacterium]|nr:N-acetyltransferase [Gammaproteobacteria bacterium]HIL95854.1 N-acetyltransferase [Pseudomonadales bacterium]
MEITRSTRLIIRTLDLDDAAFILELYNTEGFLRFISDRQIRNLRDAKAFLRLGPMKMYEKRGLGMYMVELRDGSIPLGVCGLLQRDYLDDVDLGYGFLPGFQGSGYALEAAMATVAVAKSRFGLDKLLAIVDAQNERSIALLLKLGMHFEKYQEQAPRLVSLYRLEL